MQNIKSISIMKKRAQAFKAQGKRIALVPTMGYLHEGHLSLIDLAKEKADVVIVSVFVNPKQFGPGEGFERYPRDFKRDAKQCEARGVTILFAPEIEAFYPQDFSTYVRETQVSSVLCGISRPDHFQGVGTVITKLFHIIDPDLAVLGQKDAQQAAMIKRIVKDLNLSIDIEIGATVRELDGLAMSSRNRYLSPSQRKEAAKIYKSFKKAKTLIAEGITYTDRILGEVTQILSSSTSIRIIYVAIVDRETLKPLREIIPGKALLAVAVWLNEVRLIDNTEL